MSTTFELNKTNVTAINITPKNSTQAVSLNYVQDEDKHILWYSGKKVSIGGNVYSCQFTGEQLSYSAIVSNIKNAGADVSKAAFNPTLTNPTTVGDYVYGPIVPSLGNVWSDTISITEKYITFSVDPSYLNTIFSISKSASALGIYPGLSLTASCDQIDLYDIQTGGSELNSVADGDTIFNTILSYVQSGFEYQWERNNGEDYENITGATSASYIIQNSDIGYEIRCKISFKGTTNVAGPVDSNNKIFYTSWTDTVYTNKLDSSIFTTGQVKTYDGVERSVIPTSVTYDSSTGYYKRASCYFSISGSTKGTAAQSYSYTVTPVGGTVWSDTGTSAPKTFTWSIGKLTLNKTDYYDDGYYVWDGSAKEILLSSTSYVTISGTTNGTNAGTYTVKVTPDSNHQWSDGTTGAYTISWYIDPMTVQIPTVETGLTYTGSSQTGVTYDTTSTYYKLSSGSTSATNAGSYSATFTIRSAYTGNVVFSDNSTEVIVSWSISKFTITKDMVTANASVSGTTVYGNGNVTSSVPGSKSGLTYKGYFFKQTKTNNSWPSKETTGTWGDNEMSDTLGVNSKCSWSLTETTRIAFRVTAIASSNTNYTGWTGSKSNYKGGSGWQTKN